AYAKTDIPAFTGVDGKTYGPYKAGEVMVIPKDDAERLVMEGKATFTPPITLPKMVTYLTAYAKTDIPAFTGVDGKTYGPYKAGEVMVIPKDDAERLVKEGKATFTPPAPAILKSISDTTSSILSTAKGTSEAVSRLFDAVSSLSNVVSKVSDLAKITSDTAKETSKAVSSLSDSIKDLKATISGMTSLVYASIGVSVITLILVLVTLAVALRKRS
ncbi:hypothetical protein J7L18_03405, partial [Candidatus Bathyarchaeota archaeon]|nr:hypothetical protein [Candidatus Bathyarchaeota archaeon]